MNHNHNTSRSIRDTVTKIKTVDQGLEIYNLTK